MNFNELSRFYQNFASLDHAGITYLKTFETFKKNEHNADKAYKLQFLIEHLRKNRRLSEGLKFIKFVPVFDIPLIKAAEDSGKMGEVFKTLSAKYAEAAAAEKEIRGRMIQPVLTLVVALFVPSFPELFANKITLASYLKHNLGALIALFGSFYGLYYLWKKSFFELEMAIRLHKLLSFLPFFRGFGKKIALEKFSGALAMMLDSGMDLFESLTQSALCSADPIIKKSVDQFIPMIRRGVDITKVFQSDNYFPPDLINAISMGADSGKLPEFLRRYSEVLKAEIDVAIKVIAKIIPMVMYAFVLVYSLSIVLRMYQGHINDINEVLKE